MMAQRRLLPIGPFARGGGVDKEAQDAVCRSDTGGGESVGSICIIKDPEQGIGLGWAGDQEGDARSLVEGGVCKSHARRVSRFDRRSPVIVLVKGEIAGEEG